MRVAQTLRLAILFAAIAANTLHADSPAEMLEKGIYNEDTIGNLDEAIKIYRKVVSSAGETQALGAKAQYRLAQCLQKQGKKDEATAAFKALVDKFPNQKELVAKAKKQLPDELVLGKAPWKDGERLTMRMRLAGGQDIGLVGVGVGSTKLDGEDVWEMTIRRFVSAANNEGVSKVWVNKDTYRPRRSTFNHTVLGQTNAKWTDDTIELTKHTPDGKTKESKVDLDELAYSNDQVFYGFRQLPLKIGYKGTVPIRVAFTGGSAMDLEVTVDQKEKIETPLGTYDCFRLETNINQSFWIADVPERYMVQFEAEGVTAKLESISYANKAQTFKHPDLGFECTVPNGWFSLSRTSDNEQSGGVVLVAPNMASATVFVKDKSELKEEQRDSLDAWMQAKIARSKKAFKQFQVGPDGIQKTKIGSLDALAMNSMQKVAKRDVVFGLTLGLGENQSAQMSINSAKSQWEDAQKQFDAIRTSFKLR